MSKAIWHTARLDRHEHNTYGWLGRAMDERSALTSDAPHSVLLGDESPPVALRGRRSTTAAFANLQDLKLTLRPTHPRNLTSLPANDTQSLIDFARRATLDAYVSADLVDEVVKRSANTASAYPSSKLANRLKSVGQLIKAGFATPVYYAIQPGYDTHAAQLPRHARLLRELAEALKAFLDDMRAAQLDDRVLVLCFSEFGRRVKEDASLGTDHGTAGPVFVAGSQVPGGLIGQTPSLTDLQDGDLKVSIDFRRVYATLLKDWLRISPDAVLSSSFDTLRLLRAGG